MLVGGGKVTEVMDEGEDQIVFRAEKVLKVTQFKQWKEADKDKLNVILESV